MSPKAVTPRKSRLKLTTFISKTKMKSVKDSNAIRASPSPVKVESSSSGGKSKTIFVPSMFSATPVVDDKHRLVKNFLEWFHTLVDEHQESLSLYLAEDVVLEWFGRTVCSKKKVMAFWTHEMKMTSHYFTNVDVCAPFTVRARKTCAQVESEEELASPLDSCATPATFLNLSLTQLSMRGSSGKKRSATPSPPGSSGHKRFKKQDVDFDSDNEKDTIMNTVVTRSSLKKRSWQSDVNIDSGGGGDGGDMTYMTPPNKHSREGEFRPHKNAIGLCHYAEASGYIEFSRSRKRRGDIKWERKCRLRICYSVNKGRLNDYLIHAIAYSDSSKCRRNLLPEFEEVAHKADEKARKKADQFSKTSSS